MTRLLFACLASWRPTGRFLFRTRVRTFGGGGGGQGISARMARICDSGEDDAGGGDMDVSTKDS